MPVCALHMYSADRGQKMASEFLELNYRLSLVTQYSNQTLVLWKSSMHSQPLNLLSRPLKSSLRFPLK